MSVVYVSPEQQIKDRAEFARKGIARGRSVIVMSYRDGVLFAADNPSTTLHKISEIYDRIGFAAVGRYNEFENLRIAGIRYADLRGYAYDRRDVTARGLAVTYAQQLGFAFSSATDKPIEAELIVAEITDDANQIFQISFDGTIVDHAHLAVIGGQSEQVRAQIEHTHDPRAPIDQAVTVAADALAKPLSALEIAVLDRTTGKRRTFRRYDHSQFDDMPPSTRKARNGS